MHTDRPGLSTLCEVKSLGQKQDVRMNVICEIASLKSCIDERVHVQNDEVDALVNQYLEDSTITLPDRIDGQFIVQVDFPTEVNLLISISKDYPAQKPQVTLQGLSSRELRSNINQQVQDLHSPEKGEQEVTLYDLVELVKSCIASASPETPPSGEQNDVNEDTKTLPTEACREQYGRIIFYAHHLLAASKRKDMRAMAKDLDMHVACKTGYPGLIAAEGTRTSINVLVKEIKSMRWHTIALKYELYMDLTEPMTWKSHSLLVEQYWETGDMSLFAKSIQHDPAWMQAIMH